MTQKEKDAFTKVIADKSFDGLRTMAKAVAKAYGSTDAQRDEVYTEVIALCGALLYRFGLHPQATKQDFEYFFFAISLLTKFITNENNKTALVKPTASKGDYGAN